MNEIELDALADDIEEMCRLRDDAAVVGNFFGWLLASAILIGWALRYRAEHWINRIRGMQ